MEFSSNHLVFQDLDSVLVVMILEGLFDRTPETAIGGPTYREFREEFERGLGASHANVLLDVRTAGEFNHRTLSMLFKIIKVVFKGGGSCAICGTTNEKQIWDICKLSVAAPFFLELTPASIYLSQGNGNDASK